MKVVKGMPDTHNTPKHKWDELLDGKCRELIPGKDFTCNVSAMAAQIYRNAKKRKIPVETRLHNGRLYVRATKR